MNDYNTAVNESDTKFIYEGCAMMVPSIKHARVIDEVVGLRPGRTYVRLEQATYSTSNIKYTFIYLSHRSQSTTKKYSFNTIGDGKCLQIIHNYGHGGAGVTLSYGCAVEVCGIIFEKYSHNFSPKNKL